MLVQQAHRYLQSLYYRKICFFVFTLGEELQINDSPRSGIWNALNTNNNNNGE